MNIKAGNSTTPITIHQSKDVINIESKSTHINVNSDSAVAAIVQAVINLKQVVDNIDTTGAKESTLLQGIADLKDAFANIDLSSLETTLVSGLNEVKDAVNNIDFTDLENSIAEVKNAVVNIDFSALAKEETLTQGISSVESKVEEVGNKIDNIKLPEIDTTKLAKEATLEEVKAEVQKVSSLDSDILLGKTKIAAAITQKGVPTAKSDSLNNMAAKINQIRQTNNTGTSDWEEFSFPEECSYNAYRFAKDLMESELPVKYPSYLRDYLAGYGANSFWVGEFSAITGSLVLSMADAYYTSDGHFYSHVNGVVVHTLPDGSIETYESDVVEHNLVFDGSANILVAHIYSDSAYAVNKYSSTDLIGVVACGNCLAFSSANTYEYIISLGEIHNVELNPTSNPKRRFIVRGLKSNGVILINNFNLLSIELPDLEEISAPICYSTNQIPGVSKIVLPSLIKNTTYIIKYNSNNTSNMVEYFIAPRLKKLYHIPFYHGSGGGDHFANFKEIHFNALEDMNGYELNIRNNGHFGLNSLKKVYMPNVKKTPSRIFGCYTVSRCEKKSLIDVEVGEVENSMNFDFWTATNVLSDPDKTIQLQNNIHNHIAAKVKDVTGESPLTITFSQAVRDVLLPETEELFAAKNWNIAPAKTV